MIPIASLFATFLFFLLFMFVMISLGIALYHRSKPSTGLSEAEKTRIQVLEDTAQKLEQRVKTLESILDQAIPDWRKPK